MTPDAGGEDRTLTVREPDTGREIGRVPVRGPEEVREMVDRARAAGRIWADRSLEERTDHLRRIESRLVERMDEVAGTVARETGKTLVDVYMAEIHPACDSLAYAARHAGRVLGERRHRFLGPGTHRGRVRWEPHGVAGVITPWNFPLAITAGAVASALAAGNAVVLKPSELTPYTSLAFGELAAEVLPEPDLVQVATGDGSTGRALVDAPVDVVAFTGSVDTGRKVMERAARHLTPVVLELGGKDAMIVLEDADLERAARGAVWGAFFHAGQICQSVERVLVHRDVHDRFLRMVEEETRRLRTGPRSEDPDVGALTRPEQIDVVEDHVEDARSKGAEVLTGGRRREGPGTFYEPTVLAGVTPEMRVFREETFGPVLPVIAVDDEEEAVRLANDSRYGLDAYVWTADRERGWRLARQLEAGSVMLNDCLTNYGLPDLPFGGVKESGFGRTHGEEGLRAFARPRSEAEPNVTMKREAHWFPGADRADWARALVRLLHGEGVAGRLGGLARVLRPGRQEGPPEAADRAGEARRGVGQATAYGGDPVEAEAGPEKRGEGADDGPERNDAEEGGRGWS